MRAWGRQRIVVAKPPKKVRRGPSEKPPTAPELIVRLTAEIEDLEKEIAGRVTDYKKIRTQLIAGVTTFHGVQLKEQIEDLTKKLSELKAHRTQAFEKVDGICGDASGKVIKSYDASTYVKPGGCAGGCKPSDLSFWSQGSVDTCAVCGTAYPHLDNTMEGVNYADYKFMDFPKRRNGGYKPPNHFAEIIAQFQGKRRSLAPKDIVELVSDYCTRYKFEKHKITPQIVRMFLKQKQQEENTFRKYAKVKPPSPARKYTDYYKYCPEIAWRLSGIPPPYMTPTQEDRIIAMFPLVVEAYKTSPRYLTRKADRTNRKKPNPNLLNYHYVFYKEAQLLGYEEFLPYIPLPKSTSNIDENDEAGWKHVCETNGWFYIPTR